MAASKAPPASRTLDGDPEQQQEPFAPMRGDSFELQSARIQSGGLSDDPTESGDPVRNRRSSSNLKGGR